MADVFISYKKERRAHAQRLAIVLEAFGFDVWWDYELAVGPNYRDQIETELLRAKAAVVLWCSGSVRSKFVRSEARRADEKGRLVQAYIEHVQAPIGLDEAQGANLTTWSGAPDDPGLNRLLDSLVHMTGVSKRHSPYLIEALAAHLPALPVIEPLTAEDIEEGDDVRDLAAAAPAPPAPEDREAIFFQSCHSADDFDAYISRYPDGHFVSVAKSRLAALDAEWLSSLGVTQTDWNILRAPKLLAKLGSLSSRAALERRAGRQNVEAMTILGMRFEESGNPGEAIRMFEAAAEAGFPRAQFNYGVMLAEDPTHRDDVAAVKWLRKAAEQGHALAQDYLGWMLARGRGVAKDEVEAIRWYTRSAEQGWSFAQYNLGTMYAEGRGVRTDPVQAMRWLRMASEGGVPMATYRVGKMIELGVNGRPDPKEALTWYVKARDAGFSPAVVAVKRLEGAGGR